MTVIQCVPNISEGRRPEIISGLVFNLRQIQGLRILDFSSDSAHHRSVITMVGEKTPLHSAIILLFENALTHLDLRSHQGEHPRIGAIDVVPFIPIKNSTMADCIELARTTAKEVAKKFNIPVYLYEEAATNLTRKNLENIRRGGFETLSTKMREPEWMPDFGPSSPHPSVGATIIGARKPLIAYNVNLNTSRLEIAKNIAATIRHSNGGLSYLKAIGVSLPERGIVQVSMNLTNYEETSLPLVFKTIQREATHYKIAVLESEIVGLIPEAALASSEPHLLGLKNFSKTQLLETHFKESH
tara:strand:- start:696 stop:1595 length:900 start_codon:yes stop_codon:yes gene_type:complete